MRSASKALSLVASLILIACGVQGEDGAAFQRSTADLSQHGTIDVGGRKIPRLAAPPVEPANQAAVQAFMAGFVADPVTDFRTTAAAETAVGLAVKTRAGVPVRLGNVAYVRPGLGNIMPSPAQIFVLAQQFRNVVLLYTNMTDTRQPTGLRRVSEVDGVAIPAALTRKVRIWAIGSNKYNLISYMQQSDVTLEQLDVLHRHRASLGFDPLRSAGWVFAHSQGAPDTVLSDYRLRGAGFAPYGVIVTFGSAIKGGRVLGTALGDAFVQSAFDVAGEQGRNAMLALTPAITTANLLAVLPARSERALDFYLRLRISAAFGGAIDPAAPAGNVRASFLFLATLPDYLGQVTPNDGVENIDSTTLGLYHRTIPQTDHILIIEDPQLLHDALGGFLRL